MATATKKLATAINFGTFTGHSGAIAVTHVGLYSAATGGTLYSIAPIGGASPYSVSISAGSSITIPANSLVFKEVGTAGAVIGDALAMAILNAFLGATTLGAATYYPRFFSVAPLGDGTGGTEFPNTGNYVALVTAAAITNNVTNFPAATMI